MHDAGMDDGKGRDWSGSGHHHCACDRLCVRPGAGVFGGVSENPALYRDPGRHVLCKGHDLHHQPGDDKH